MVILFRVLTTLHGVLNPPYTAWELSEWWLLFIFNSVQFNIYYNSFQFRYECRNNARMILRYWALPRGR